MVALSGNSDGVEFSAASKDSGIRNIALKFVIPAQARVPELHIATVK